MQKGDAVTNTITIVGFLVIGALMFTRIPGMIDDIKEVLSKTSVMGKAAEIADLMTIADSSNDIRIKYEFPKDSVFTLSVNGGYVNVSNQNEWSASKTTSSIVFGPEIDNSIIISKTGIEKVG